MKDNFKLYAQDKFIRLSVIFSGIIFIIQAALLFLNQPHLPPFVPFFNSMPWGEDRLIPSQYVLLLFPALALFFLLNTILSIFVYKKYTLASRILVFNSLFFLTLAVIAYIQIMILVF